MNFGFGTLGPGPCKLAPDAPICSMGPFKPPAPDMQLTLRQRATYLAHLHKAIFRSYHAQLLPYLARLIPAGGKNRRGGRPGGYRAKGTPRRKTGIGRGHAAGTIAEIPRVSDSLKNKKTNRASKLFPVSHTDADITGTARRRQIHKILESPPLAEKAPHFTACAPPS